MVIELVFTGHAGADDDDPGAGAGGGAREGGIMRCEQHYRC